MHKPALLLQGINIYAAISVPAFFKLSPDSLYALKAQLDLSTHLPVQSLPFPIITLASSLILKAGSPALHLLHILRTPSQNDFHKVSHKFSCIESCCTPPYLKLSYIVSALESRCIIFHPYTVSYFPFPFPPGNFILRIPRTKDLSTCTLHKCHALLSVTHTIHKYTLCLPCRRECRSAKAVGRGVSTRCPVFLNTDPLFPFTAP